MVKRSLQQRLVQARGPAHHPRLGVRVFLEQQGGKHRHQRERQQQRDAQGEHDGQRHRHEQFAFQPLQREQGMKVRQMMRMPEATGTATRAPTRICGAGAAGAHWVRAGRAD